MNEISTEVVVLGENDDRNSESTNTLSAGQGANTVRPMGRDRAKKLRMMTSDDTMSATGQSAMTSVNEGLRRLAEEVAKSTAVKERAAEDQRHHQSMMARLEFYRATGNQSKTAELIRQMEEEDNAARSARSIPSNINVDVDTDNEDVDDNKS
jgi:hypothetical protein